MFPEIIEDLVASGLTESEIAARVESTQPSINRIRRGKQNPSYALGDALRKLRDLIYADRVGSKREAA